MQRAALFVTLLLSMIASTSAIFMPMITEPPALEIGPDTTVIDGPRRADGTIYYAAYLNGKWAKELTLANNAGVDLVLVLDEEYLKQRAWFRAASLDWFGVPEADRVTPRFIDRRVFSARQGLALDKFDDDLEEAQQNAWRHDDYPRVAQWLDGNEAALGLLAASVHKPHFVIPLLNEESRAADRAMSAYLPHVSIARMIMRAWTARANLALGEGRSSDAVDDALTALRWARVFGRQPVMIGWLVAQSNEIDAFDLLARIVGSGALTVEEIGRIQAELADLPARTRLADLLDANERFFSLDQAQFDASEMMAALTQVREILGDDVPESLDLLDDVWIRVHDPNAALREVNRQYDRIVEILDLTTYQAVRDAWRAFQSERREAEKPARRLVLEAMTRDIDAQERAIVSRALVSSLIPDPRVATEANFVARARESLFDATMALVTHRLINRNWPQQSDVVRDWPLDPFNDEPLHYRVNDDGSVTVWSVGPNLEDDDAHKRDDVVLTLKKPSN